MLHRRDGAMFPPDVTLDIQAKEFNFGFIRPDDLVSHGLRVFWQTPSGLSCVFYWGVASVWPLYYKGLIAGVQQRWLSFWKVLPSPQRNSGALSEWPSGSLSPKPILPWLLSLAGQPALGRVLVDANFFHLRMMGATVFLGTFNASEMFWYPSPDLCLDIILSWSSTAIPSNSWFGVCSDCVTLYRQVCAFPNHVQSTEFHTDCLQSSCRNISKMINGSRMHMSPISSLIA
jgi:hypothetical protein